MTVQLTKTPDIYNWNLTYTGMFTIKSMYLYLMNGHTKFLRKYLWKMKIPLKFKIFMWFLNNKVILTKDNVAKRNGMDVLSFFVTHWRIVDHLFISCPFACIIWRIIYFTFNISPPANFTNMFGNWLNGVNKNDKARICISVLALCWSTAWMILFLINKRVLFICWLFLEIRIRSSYGLLYSRRINGRLWLLDAIGCWWSHILLFPGYSMAIY
jgi:hypothetical protein